MFQGTFLNASNSDLKRAAEKALLESANGNPIHDAEFNEPAMKRGVFAAKQFTPKETLIHRSLQPSI